MFQQTVPLGRIAGIRIGAHWSVLVTITLFVWILGLQLRGTGSPALVWPIAVCAAVALFACLIAHELAHSIVARRHGVRVERIVLWMLGGASELRDEPRDASGDLRIAIAGPATSFALGVVFAAAAVVADAVWPDSAVVAALAWLTVTNIVLALFNLLPGAPLDGGRVLRAIVWWRTGDRLRAATVAARSGRLLGTMLVVVGAIDIIALRQLGGLWLILLGWFLQTAANSELAVAGLRHRLGGTTVRDVMTRTPMAVPGEWTIAQLLGSDAPHTGHRVFPVVDAVGHPTGVLAWSDLLSTRAEARATTFVRSVARPLRATAIARQDELLADVATRVVLRPRLDAVAVVDSSGHLTGLITATDLATACDRSALGLPPGETSYRPATDSTYRRTQP
ncbi:site-2 protease family protein [Nocardia spumae]|uniref:site-2 protease family protein n=1 Tax=Nocardia spumae TaxID=2887190 RepID=UPI001D14F4C5|nr:site-2 protease family protein [Nocardia spumae]